MARQLRIAVSVFFGMLTVAIVVLWVWNEWCHDSTVVSRAEIHFVSSRIVFHLNPWPAQKSHFLRTRSVQESSQYLASVKQIDNRWGFGSANDVGTRVYVTPHWSYVLVAGIAAAAPWIPYRFSLRTLLIATTLVAVALGLGVWLAS